MDYAAALSAYQGTPTIDVLRTHLLAKTWPDQPPKLYIGPDQSMTTAGAVDASHDSASHTITVGHHAAATSEDILDNVLFEVCNALNPKIEEAAALSQREPVDNVGAARGAAEYDTLKAYVVELATIFAPGGDASGFPQLLAGQHALPTQALATIQSWVHTYEPIYPTYNVPADEAFAVIPLSLLLPLPAVAPTPPAGSTAPAAPVAAEQAAIQQFCATPHNPRANPTSESFYLALLTTRQVYAYERPRNWTMNQLKQYFTDIAGLTAAVPSLLTDVTYRRYRDAWSEATCDRRYHCYLFAGLVAELDAQHAGAIPAIRQFDQATVGVAREEAARGIAARYEAGDMKQVLPMKPWLVSDVPLRNRVDALLGALHPPMAVNLSRIK